MARGRTPQPGRYGPGSGESGRERKAAASRDDLPAATANVPGLAFSVRKPAASGGRPAARRAESPCHRGLRSRSRRGNTRHRPASIPARGRRPWRSNPVSHHLSGRPGDRKGDGTPDYAAPFLRRRSLTSGRIQQCRRLSSWGDSKGDRKGNSVNTCSTIPRRLASAPSVLPSLPQAPVEQGRSRPASAIPRVAVCLMSDSEPIPPRDLECYCHAAWAVLDRDVQRTYAGR